MSRSVRFYEIGGPEVLKIEDIKLPMPGPQEVQIKVKAIGVNRSEAMFRSGFYVIDPVFPAQLGYEAAGEVIALGSAVRGFSIGDRVSTMPAFTYAEYGMYGEQVNAPVDAVVKIADGIGWEQGAAIWVSYLTAWGALIDVAGLRKNDVVLIPAASSGVGMAAVQIAKAVGAVPVALTRTSAKAKELKENGATHVIATEEVDLVAEVMRITDGAGARVVFDPVGGPLFESLAKAAREQGILIIYGALSSQPTPLPLFACVTRRLTFRGYDIMEVTRDRAKVAAGTRFVLDNLESGLFKPKIAKTFPFEQIVEAHRYLESNQQIGKVVVTVS